MADVPGGASGLLMRAYKGKRLVTRIDPGVVALASELRGHERQAAEELGQWGTHVNEPKALDASPATFTLAQICTPEQLQEMERKALALQAEAQLEQKTLA
jgi:hypothetical protein